MKKTIFFLISILLLSTLVQAQIEDILTVKLSIDNEIKVDILDIRLQKGTPTKDEGTYSLILLSDTKEISKVNFEPQFTAWADPLTKEPNGVPFPKGKEDSIGKFGQVPLEKVELTLKSKYTQEINKLQIKKQDVLIAEGQVTLCNKDGICQNKKGENYISCEKDCPSGSQDDLCDEAFDNICDPDCKAQKREYADSDCTCGNKQCDSREDSFSCPKDCGKPKNPIMGWIIGGIIVIILIIGLIIFGIVKLFKKINLKK